jgi:thiamine pyrophosphate-dependent acetolactate synthase large subunit-like protein
MLGNAAIARILQKEGVEYLFCFPANGLIESCATIGIRPILARTERTLINMTDGYTRVHNAQKLGVCVVQGGPGAENGYAGVAQAASDSTPILLLTGGPPRQRRGIPYTFPVADAYGRSVRRESGRLSASAGPF